MQRALKRTRKHKQKTKGQLATAKVIPVERGNRHAGTHAHESNGASREVEEAQRVEIATIESAIIQVKHHFEQRKNLAESFQQDAARGLLSLFRIRMC
jgi:hypothetical protein